MIARLTEWILAGIRAHGGWSVFWGVMLEQVIVPIPSPAIIMGAGFILVPADWAWGPALRDMWWRIVLPGAAASTLGSLLIHAAAAWGGKAFVDRFERFLGFGWGAVDAFGARLRGPGGSAALFFLRVLPIMPLSLISIAAGALGLPRGAFALWTFLGSIPRCLILSVLGWKMGAGALGLARGVNRVESVLSLAIAAAFVGVILLLRRRVRASA